MEQAEEIYWLPTFQTREDSQLPILTPEQLIERLTNKDNVIISDLNDELWQHIQAARANGKLVLCMGAGTIDGWVRQQLLTD
jgi:UDP-N-acetylmuramate-alanine ligase